MRTTAEIFNWLLTNKRYQNDGYFMCVTLDRIYNEELITSKEYHQALFEIRDFIGSHCTMTGYLCSRLQDVVPTGQSPYLKLKLDIYTDWNNRETLVNQYRTNQINTKEG